MKMASGFLFAAVIAIACPTPSLYTAEIVSPAEGGVNLDDLKITSTVSWEEGWLNDRHTIYLDLSVIAEGSAAAAATACGDVELDSLTDENGQPVDRTNLTDRSDMILVNHEDGFKTHPKDGVRLSLNFYNPPPLKKLSEMRGSFALRTGGRLQEVVIADLLKYCGGDIDNKMLKKLGVTVRVARSTKPTKGSGLPSFIVPTKPNDRIDELTFLVSSSDNAVVRLEVADVNGKSFTPNGLQYDKSIEVAVLNCDDKFPDDSQLRLTIHRDAKLVRVPFALNNIEIPPQKKIDTRQSCPELRNPPEQASQAIPTQSRPLLPVLSGQSNPYEPLTHNSGQLIPVMSRNASHDQSLPASPSKVVVDEVKATRSNDEHRCGLDVKLMLSGTELQKASAVRWRLTKAIDETDTDLQQPDGEAFPPGFDMFSRTFHLNLPARKVQVIKDLSGEVDLLFPDRDPQATVKVSDFIGKPRVEVSHPSLKAGGATLTIVSKAEFDRMQGISPQAPSLTVNEEKNDEKEEKPADVLTGIFSSMFSGFNITDNSVIILEDDPQQCIMDVKFYNRAGGEISGIGVLSSTFLDNGATRKYRSFNFEQKQSEATVMKISVSTPKALVTVPFSLKDVPLP